MKRILPFLLTAGLLLFTYITNATIFTVTQQENTFTPRNIEVKVGDTVRWVWTSGLHTTTSTSIPSGASPWDSQLTIGSQQFQYKVTVEGTYNYVCTPHADLGMGGTITATPLLGIEETSMAKSMKIYPNPVKETAILTLSAEKPGNGVIALYDLLGNKVNSTEVAIRQGSNNIDLTLDALLPGIYFLELKYNNEGTIVRRIVKSN